MTTAFADQSHTPYSADFERWRRRSRLVRRLRVLLPAAIGVILLVMVGFVIQSTLAGAKDKPQDADAPIQLVNPRFLGRDDKGRAFVLTAKVAVRAVIVGSKRLVLARTRRRTVPLARSTR